MSESSSLVRVGNTLKVTDKLLEENNQRLIISEIKSVKIGDQIWMTENLNVDRFRNGDPIPEARTDEEWEKAGDNSMPAWCYYENNSENGAVFGKLYNWFAVMDSRGLAPEGQHIPNDREWLNLKENLRVSLLQKENITLNDKLFDMLIMRENVNNKPFQLEFALRSPFGKFRRPSEYGWWSCSVDPLEHDHFAITYKIDLPSKTLKRSTSTLKEAGFSVRCIKD